MNSGFSSVRTSVPFRFVYFAFVWFLWGCTSVRTTTGQDGVHSLSVTKQKQRIIFLQKKLDSAEKELQASQEAVDQLRSDLYQSQLALIGRQIDTYEQQMRKAQSSIEPVFSAGQGESKLLFAKERETLQQMMQEGPSSEALEAQFVLDRILRVITALREEK